MIGLQYVRGCTCSRKLGTETAFYLSAVFVFDRRQSQKLRALSGRLDVQQPTVLSVECAAIGQYSKHNTLENRLGSGDLASKNLLDKVRQQQSMEG